MSPEMYCLLEQMRDNPGAISSAAGAGAARAALDEIERLRTALKLMVSTYPYSPPCHGWEVQVEAHKAAKAALANS